MNYTSKKNYITFERELFTKESILAHDTYIFFLTLDFGRIIIRSHADD